MRSTRHSRAEFGSRQGWHGSRNLEVDAAVGTGGVVVLEERRQHVVEVAAVPDEHPVQALGTDGTCPPFGMRVRLRRTRRTLDHLNALGGEHGVEPRGEFGVAVSDEEPEPG
jgi:hypothetical protein